MGLLCQTRESNERYGIFATFSAEIRLRRMFRSQMFIEHRVSRISTDSMVNYPVWSNFP